ncbi:DUF427 domain-containing protein [Streptomyces sp. FXJ1.172]|uniref:DUF427 domain-containing protein n=1 Tax=Streptomyces sp. FXJ1.172 TaxID=710705 RepID=UPI001F2E549E|nr:DUF427 domain-containing protein [Streptomyces sp. FXJ1.172]WEO99707.1 DUF427 domain-containing protein [Streptomyces sp. FXJ1.172]
MSRSPGGRWTSFCEEDERILGHVADPYHRIDIRDTSRMLEVRAGGAVIARSRHPVVLCESGFAPRWYVPRADIDERRLRPGESRTFDGTRLHLGPGQNVVPHGVERGLDVNEVR